MTRVKLIKVFLHSEGTVCKYSFMNMACFDRYNYLGDIDASKNHIESILAVPWNQLRCRPYDAPIREEGLSFAFC